MSKRVALLGGTFDPVHIGHIELAGSVLRELNVDEVRLLLSYCPPHKSKLVATNQQRIEMCQLAVQGQKKLVIDDTEIRLQSCYTADTLAYFKKKEVANEWFFVLGQDAVLSFPFWKNSKEILRYATIVISKRMNCPLGDDLNRAIQFIQYSGGKVHFLQSVPSDVSSSYIRRLSEGQMFGLVPEAVRYYIKENGLYRKEE